MRAPKTSNSGTKMLFPIDQIGNKAELSNVIKNKGLNEPSLAMGRIPLPNRMNFFFDPPPSNLRLAGIILPLSGACPKDLLTLATGIL